MSEWRSEELSPSEKKAFGALARQLEPRTELEDHVVAELRRKKLLWKKRRVELWVPLAAIAWAVGTVLVVWMNVRHRGPEAHPQWMLLLREGHEDRSVSAEESRRRVSEYASWARSASTQGLIDGEKLGDGGTLFAPGSDSPAVRTPTSVSGFFLLGAVGEDAARALAASCPHLKYGGEIELRRIETTGDPSNVRARASGSTEDPR